MAVVCFATCLIESAEEHGHDGGHSHASDCNDPECTDESHGHGHSHSHAEDCSDPNCSDASHGHSHSHAEDCNSAVLFSLFYFDALALAVYRPMVTQQISCQNLSSTKQVMTPIALTLAMVGDPELLHWWQVHAAGPLLRLEVVL